jgi:hypothetical protein
MSIAYNQAQEANQFLVSKPETQQVQSTSESYILPENRIQPSIKTARSSINETNSNNSLPENLIAQDLRATITRSLYGALLGAMTSCATGQTRGVCEQQQFLFNVPASVKERYSYNQEEITRWCKRVSFDILKGQTRIGSYYLSPNYNTIAAETQNDGEFGCYINQWKWQYTRPRRVMTPDRILID